jgi:predicted Zn-dependent protease
MARLWILTLAVVLLRAQEPALRNFDLSKEREAAMGVRFAGDVRRQTSAIADAAVRDYIATLGRQLAAQMPGGDFAWGFEAIGDERGGSTHEPLSVPGGHIFVPASLILAARSEAEFAGMLALAMAHVAERHGTRTAERGQGNLYTKLVFIGGGMGMGGGNDDRSPLPVAYLSIARANELHADRVAVQAMAAAGYAPAALIGYIRRTQRDLPAASGKHSALPPRQERIGALEAAVANLPSSAGLSSGEFKATQDRVRRIVVPASVATKRTGPKF